MKKIFIGLIVLFLQVNADAVCSDEEADSIVRKKAIEMAETYKTNKFGIGQTLIMGKYRMTNVIILQGDGGTEGPIDRIGQVIVNLDKCAYHSYLIGIYNQYEIQQ